MRTKIYLTVPDSYILGIAFNKIDKGFSFGICLFKIAIVLDFQNK